MWDSVHWIDSRLTAKCRQIFAETQLNNNNIDHSPRAEHKHRTRVRIMQCAINHFQTHGYKETTLEGIAQCAGISKRTVLRYFRAKEDIAIAFAEDAYTAFTRAAEVRPRTVGIIDYWRAFTLKVNANIAKGGALVKHALLVSENPSLYGRRLHIRKRYAEFIASELSLEANVDPLDDSYAKLFSIILVHAPNNIVDELVAAGRYDEIVENALEAIDTAVCNFPKRDGFKHCLPEYIYVNPDIFDMPPAYDPD